MKEEHRYDDIEGIKRAIGVRNAALAAERKKIQPALNRMARQAAAVGAANAAVILGEDPALKAAIGAAAEHELGMAEAAEGLEYGPAEEAAPAGADVDFGDLPTAEAPAITGEDLADLV